MRSLRDAAPVGHAVAERPMELRGGVEDAPALLAREPRVRRKQLAWTSRIAIQAASAERSTATMPWPIAGGISSKAPAR